MELKTQSKELNLAEKIKKWRKKQEISQDQLARKADMPLTTLAKIEAGIIKKPSIQSMIKIANAFNITLDELIK